MDAVGLHTKQRDGRVRLRVNRPAHLGDLNEVIEDDAPVDAQVGAGALGQFSFEANVNRHRAFERCRVDPHHRSRDHAVAGVDLSPLPERNVLGLCLGDAEFGFQVARVGHTRQRRPRRNHLSDLYF